MITLHIDRVANAGEPAGGTATFSFTFTGPSLTMIPNSTLNALIALDTAITKAIADNAPGTGTEPLPEGSVVLTADDVANLDADIAAKTERVATIGQPTGPVAQPPVNTNG
jgi:hypothetical protein